MRSVLFLQAVLPSLFFQATAAADCDCGYTTDVGTGSTLSKVLFTEAFETDFRHVADLKPSEWRPQTYNKTAEQSHGRYGRMYSNSSTVPVTEGSEPGLELDVRSQVVDDMVLSGEVAAKRKDFYHGTYRTSVKLSSEVGTCAAFYWVRPPIFLVSLRIRASNIYPTVLQRYPGNRHGVPLEGLPRRKQQLPRQHRAALAGQCRHRI